MTEYVTIEIDSTGDPDAIRFITNLDLTPDGEPEDYASTDEGRDGSPLAQALFEVPGLAGLRLDGPDLVARRAPGVPWPPLIDDLSDALRDFFL
jgi:hypothetical protein